MPLFQSLDTIRFTFQGPRASLRSALAPGYYIPRLWRSRIKQFHNFNSFHFQIEFTNDKQEACACIERGADMGGEN